MNQQATSMVKYQSAGGEIALTVQDIKSVFCPKATDVEARVFLEVCRYQGLNPFLREAYLIKYQEGEPASIVVGKEVFTKRAQRIEACLGWEAGVLVSRDGVLVEQEGSFLLPGDTLLGGWVRVDRQGQPPFNHRIALEEYIQTTRQGQPTKFWSKMPATMIRKVAIVQGLRECFPEEFQGLYDTAEISGGEIVDATGHTIAEVEGKPTSVIRVPETQKTETQTMPDFGDCPEHGVIWIVEADRFTGNPRATHHITGKEWCYLDKVYKIMFDSAWAAKFGEPDPKDMNAWLKENFGGKTYSKLAHLECVQAVNMLRVDESTGEVEIPQDDSPVPNGEVATVAIMDEMADSGAPVAEVGMPDEEPAAAAVAAVVGDEAPF